MSQNTIRRRLASSGAALLLATSLAAAQQERAREPAAARTDKQTASELTVAVLDFSANTPGEPDLGKQIGEAVTVILSGEPGFKLVDRTALSRALQELELNLSGVVDTQQAVKVGKVVGARILVVGKAFTLGERTFITGKLIGTETSLVDGVLVKGDLNADVGELVMELAMKLAERLRKVGPKLVAQDDAGRDPLPALKEKLAKRAKPTVAVIIPERHLTREPRPVPDPAVETEIKLLLRKCGFTVRDVKNNALADSFRSGPADARKPWPRGLAGVDVVIVGEGYSEFAARIGNLVSCAARAEINVIERKSGQIVVAERTTERSVDLSENIAGKKALQKTGRVLGIRILEYFAETLK